MCNYRGDEEEAREPEGVNQHIYLSISKNGFIGYECQGRYDGNHSSRSALLFIYGRNPEVEQTGKA